MEAAGTVAFDKGYISLPDSPFQGKDPGLKGSGTDRFDRRNVATHEIDVRTVNPTG